MPEPVNGLKRKILLALRAALNGLLALAFFGLALFVPAQTLDFPNAWPFGPDRRRLTLTAPPYGRIIISINIFILASS